jgi:syntaxin 5
MTATSIQDRTGEFASILAQAQRRNPSGKANAQRQQLLTATEQRAANGSATPTAKQRSDFAKRASEIARGISSTMGKLDRLAQLAKRKTLFDDRPVEIAELTYVVKQDMAAMSQQITALQSLSRQQHPSSGKGGDQEGEHNQQIVELLSKKLKLVGTDFKEVLEVRSKNMLALNSRSENFKSAVSAHSQPGNMETGRTDSPLYQAPSRGRSPRPGSAQNSSAVNQDLLTLDPSSSSSALTRGQPQSDQQLLMMEEAQSSNSYVQQRGEAIETIERTIHELGGIFGQLAQMVSEQGEQIQRIDADTEDVVDNVQGAQRELMKYWNRVSGNRWLVAKMFGVLMICKFPLGDSAACVMTSN